MSTNYYRPAEPVTQVVVRAISWSSERFVHIWIQTVKAGKLRMGEGAVTDLAHLLSRGQPTAAIRLEVDDEKVLRIEDNTLRSDDTLISEHGHITSLDAVARDVDMVLRWGCGHIMQE